MTIKKRTESIGTKIMKSKDVRVAWNKTERLYFLNQIKGLEGELLFDSFTEKLECDCLVLNDLLLQFNNIIFQIDSLIVTPEILYLFEVKDYEGDFYYESDRLYKKPKTERNNPLIQLHRSESLLRQLIQGLGFTIPIQAYFVFVNSAFTLYQTPLNKPIIFPTQLNAFFQNLNKSTTKINNKHKLLAEKLVSLHVYESPYSVQQKYKYTDFRKGICCVMCGSLSVKVDRKNCVCVDCEHMELINDAIKRSAEELKLLFPEFKITTNLVHEWCQVIESKKRIQRILEKCYKIVKNNRWMYYE